MNYGEMSTRLSLFFAKNNKISHSARTYFTFNCLEVAHFLYFCAVFKFYETKSQQ